MYMYIYIYVYIYMAFTRYCHYQLCVMAGRGGVGGGGVYCVMFVQ